MGWLEMAEEWGGMKNGRAVWSVGGSKGEWVSRQAGRQESWGTGDNQALIQVADMGKLSQWFPKTNWSWANLPQWQKQWSGTRKAGVDKLLVGELIADRCVSRQDSGQTRTQTNKHTNTERQAGDKRQDGKGSIGQHKEDTEARLWSSYDNSSWGGYVWNKFHGNPVHSWKV